MRKIRCLTNLKAVDCCKTPTNEKTIYFLLIQIHLSSSKIRSLNSSAIRDNTRLIARCPFTSFR